jgi:hypothetical protein
MSRAVTYSNFYCTQCTNKISLPRKNSKQRERNHLKNIYCIKCKEEVNHYEVRSCDHDFVFDVFAEKVAAREFKTKKGDAVIEKISKVF